MIFSFLPNPPPLLRLQAERTRVLLLDTAAAPLAELTGGGRHDFILEQDLKVRGQPWALL